MSTDYTPSPWAISKIANHYDDYSIYSETENPQYNIASSVRGKANALLMAAAPDLLSSLQELEELARRQLDQSPTHDGLQNCTALANARRAIARAIYP